MTYVMGILSKREDYQSSVLKSLTTIELKQGPGTPLPENL